MTKINRKAVGSALALAGFLLLTPSVTEAQSSREREIRQLQADLARYRTQLSAINSDYRAAQATAAKALHRVSNGFGGVALAAETLKLLGPVGTVAKAASITARTYDAVTASLRAGRLTTTKKELERLIANLEQARLDACIPWVNRITKTTARLQALGVRNP